MKNKESTVTIFGETKDGQKPKNMQSDVALKAEKSQEILVDVGQNTLKQSQNQLLQKTDSEQKMLALYKGTQSRSLLGTQSSASVEILEHKLGAADPPLARDSGNVIHQLSQEDLENTAMMQTFREVTGSKQRLGVT